MTETAVQVPQAAPDVPLRGRADIAMRRVLQISDESRTEAAPTDAHGTFTTSLLVSATRCLLTYLVLPFLAPAAGFAAGVGPWIGIPLSLVGIAANVVSIRRFWAADHRWRWAYSAVGVGVIVLLAVLAAGDLAALAR